MANACDQATLALTGMVNLCARMLVASVRVRWASWVWRANSPRYAVEARGARFAANHTPANANDTADDTSTNQPTSASSTHSVPAASTIAPPPGSPASSTASKSSVRRIVVTVHGYLGVPRPFLLWRGPLEAAGYHLADYAYDSGDTMEQIARGLNAFLEDTIRRHSTSTSGSGSSGTELQFDFVAHSMGGLVLRYAINSDAFPIPIPTLDAPSATSSSSSSSTSSVRRKLTLGRIVMIATPNQGSEYARALQKYPRLKRIVLGFAKLKIPGATWLRGIRTDLDAPVAQQQPSPPSSLSSRSDAAAAAVECGSELLACGDVLMTHPASWFRRHVPLPRALYPRTLVIAGTMSLLQGVAPQPSDGTILFEETKLPETSAPHQHGHTHGGGGGEPEAPPIPPFQPRTSASPVSAGPAGSQHMSFHAQHSFLLAHPGVMDAALRFLQTGRAD